MRKTGYYVYMHKNKSNGKVYIGITSQKPEQRWRNGTNYYGNKYFNRSIHKYGWDGFEHIILYKNLTKEEAEMKEIELIKEYNSTNRDYGYNIENGGNSTGKHSEETKRKISESQKGELNHMYGKTGNLSSRSKKVICLNNNKIYGSAYEANRNIDSKTSVSECCNRRKKFAGRDENGNKLLWMWYEEYTTYSKEELENKINELIENLKPKKKKIHNNKYENNSNSKSIKCLNDNKIYKCIKLACEFYNVSPSAISQNLKGTTKYCKSKETKTLYSFEYYREEK